MLPSSELDFFRTLRWHENRFAIERSDGSLLLVVHKLQIQDEAPRLVRLSFAQPSSEWAMLWDAQTNQWKEHPEATAPIGGMR